MLVLTYIQINIDSMLGLFMCKGFSLHFFLVNQPIFLCRPSALKSLENFSM